MSTGLPTGTAPWGGAAASLRRLSGFGLGLLLSLTVWSCPPDGGTASLSGEVLSQGSLNGLEVELLPVGPGASFGGQAEVSPFGGFEISDVCPGWYQLQLLDRSGRVIQEEQVLVGPATRVMLQPSIPEPQGSGSTSVSVRQLAAKIPRAAVREFEAALKALRGSAAEVAALHLKKALAIYPRYVDAHNELGVCEILQKHPDRAVPEFRAAVTLDPYAAAPWSNLGVALFALKRYGEAADAAQHAVRLDPGLMKARFMLGMSLYATKSDDRAALVYLEESADEFPRAHLAAAEILAADGSRAKAATQVREYLKQFDGTANRQAVETWLKDLETNP